MGINNNLGAGFPLVRHIYRKATGEALQWDFTAS